MAKFTGHTITNDSALGSAVVQRSLKFQASDNTRLVRTIGSTSNRRTFTYSFWIKRTMQSAEQYVLYNGHSSSTPYFDARFEANSHQFQFIDYTGSWPLQLKTNRRFRDCTSWYHFVIAIDTEQGTASNRAKLYINGVQETSFSTETYPSQNHDTAANVSGNIQVWGTNKEGTSNDLDGYLAEAHFVDGQQLTPSSFGFTESQTGLWMPKRYEGTHGTNGFYLDFSDNSSTAALGIDKSPNGNDFTASNFSVSAGVGDDSSLDTPSNNFCTLNPLKTNPSNRITFTEGMLQHNGVSGNNHLRSHSTMSVSDGKWYMEFKFVSGYETNDNTVSFGICTNGGHRASNNDAVWYENSVNFRARTYGNDGSVRKINASSSTTLISGLEQFDNGDIMGIALDLENNKMFVSKNGTFFSNGTGTQDPVTGTNPLFSGTDISSRNEQGWFFTVSGYSDQVVTADFGQQGFDYTPPTGFKSLCTRNMKPELTPAIIDPEKHFKCFKYTGTGATQKIDTVEFRPDLIWCKRIENTSYHILTDSVNGAGKYFVSNTADGLSTGGAQIINAIRDNGFQVGTESNVNGNGETYTAWCWKAGGATVTNTDGSITSQVSANTEAGFSIIQYSGTGTTGTVGHGLGRTPRVIFFRNHNGEGHDWNVYYNTPNGYGAGVRHLKLNQNSASAYATNKYNSTPATSSVITVHTAADNNQSGQTITAYCWANIPGYQKIGVYRGNNDNDGEYIYTGFRPRWVWVKNLDGGHNWLVWDAARETENEMQAVYEFNSTNESGSSSNTAIDFLAMGFKHRTNFMRSNNNEDFLYMAIAETVGMTPYDVMGNAR